jgi:phosphomannomutase
MLSLDTKLKAFNPSVFHAYDIRGRYPEELDLNTVELTVSGFAYYLRKNGGGRLCLLGQDVRASSSDIAEVVRETLLKRGMDVIDLGVVTTPMFAFARSFLKASGGVMVTASHNVSEFNGLKLYEGMRSLSIISGLREIKESMIPNLKDFSGREGVLEKRDLKAEYVKFLTSKIFLSRNPRAVFDTGGGTVGLLLPSILEKLGMEASCISLEVDPTLSRRVPDPLLPQAHRATREVILKGKAEAGFVFDPDGDRVVLLDERGEVVPADALLWLLSMHFASPGDTVVHDVRASHVLSEALEARDIRTERVRVGHSFVEEAMRSEDAVLGGELSGHFYFKDFFYTESALLASLKILHIIAENSFPLSRLVKPFKRYFHSGNLNFKIKEKQEVISALDEKYKDGKRDYLDGLTVEYPEWWFNVRPSNTEDFLRLVIEAKYAKVFEEKKEDLFNLLSRMGAKQA